MDESDGCVAPSLNSADKEDGSGRLALGFDERIGAHGAPPKVEGAIVIVTLQTSCRWWKTHAHRGYMIAQCMSLPLLLLLHSHLLQALYHYGRGLDFLQELE